MRHLRDIFEEQLWRRPECDVAPGPPLLRRPAQARVGIESALQRHRLSRRDSRRGRGGRLDCRPAEDGHFDGLLRRAEDVGGPAGVRAGVLFAEEGPWLDIPGEVNIWYVVKVIFLHLH